MLGHPQLHVDDEADDDLHSIGVYARLRPGTERDASIVVRRRFDQQRLVQVRNLEFSMDWVFDSTASQEEVYETVGERRVARVLEGYNVCFLAYGQTGSGKTHTVYGPREVIDDWENSDESLHGIAPRAVRDFFEGVYRAPPEMQFLVSASYCEVHNDSVNDLLAGRKNLALRETSDQRVKVEGLSAEVVASPQEAMAALGRGNAARSTAAMKMNTRSSRSHAIFILALSHVGGDAATHEMGRLVLVDLAGMESSKKSYSVAGASSKPQRREEAKNINTSLYALGSVIERLSAGSRGAHGALAHVPYRDAKLTRLLQESLSGASCAAIIVTLRTEHENVDETIGTLRFAQRAKAVPVSVRPVQAHRGDSEQMHAELGSLRDELATARRMIEKLTGQLSTAAAVPPDLAGQVREIVSGLGGGDAAARVALLEVENRSLKKRNLTLRATAVWQRLMKLHHAHARRALEKREADREDELANTSRDLAATRQALTMGLATPGGAMGDSLRSVRDPSAAITSDRIVRGQGGEVDPMYGILFSPRSRPYGRVGGRAGVLVSDDARRWDRFQELAAARKIALASRGYETEGVFIGELFDEATRANVPPNGWHDFLRQAIPSPRASPTRLRAGDVTPAAIGGAGAASSMRRCGSVQRFTMPFSSNWEEGSSSVEAAHRLDRNDPDANLAPSATELLDNADAADAYDDEEEEHDGGGGGGGGFIPPSASVIRAVKHGQRDPWRRGDGANRPRVVGQAEGATLLKGRLALDSGYEGWRSAMELTNEVRPVDPLAVQLNDLRGAGVGAARRDGERRDAAFVLATAAEVSANAAAVRAGPAQRATDDAHRVALRAAAASEEARHAASRAAAARVQANVSWPADASPVERSRAGKPDPNDPGAGAVVTPDMRRAKLRLLPL